MEHRAPSVSVVIPHFGDPAPTRALVRSLKGQGQAEVIVVDDCSPTPLGPVDGAIVLTNARNGGFGTTVNAGAAAANSDLMLVLNSDLEVSPDFVAELTSASIDLQPAVVSPHVVSPSGHEQWVGRHFPSVRAQAIEWLTPLARFREERWWHEGVGHDTRCAPGEVVNVDWVVGAVMLIPLEEFRAIGGFDEGFHMNSEEVDLQRRLRRRGVPSHYLGTVTAIHEGGGSSDPTRRRRWLVQSRLRYAQKWRGSALPTQLVLSLMSIVNAGFNAVRHAAGTEVNPLAVLREELGYVWVPPESPERTDWRTQPVA